MPSMMGSLYRTNSDAWTACAYEWATAGGLNSPADAAEHLTDPVAATAEMESNGWSWATGEGDEPDADDIADACDAARQALLAEID